jgi:anti-sigma B factor antagonist
MEGPPAFSQPKCAPEKLQSQYAGTHLNCIQSPLGYNGRMPVTATIERLPEDAAVITLTGHLTLGTSLKVAESQLLGVIADGVTKIVVDLTGVDYMDSAGLGMLVFGYGTLSEKNGAFRLCGVSHRILSLLQITKTDTFMAIDQDREQSLAALKKS